MGPLPLRHILIVWVVRSKSSRACSALFVLDARLGLRPSTSPVYLHSAALELRDMGSEGSVIQGIACKNDILTLGEALVGHKRPNVDHLVVRQIDSSEISEALNS